MRGSPVQGGGREGSFWLTVDTEEPKKVAEGFSINPYPVTMRLLQGDVLWLTVESKYLMYQGQHVSA